MITTSLIKNGLIDIWDSHGKIDFGTEQIKISDEGRKYVESRKNWIAQFWHWLYNGNTFQNLFRLITFLIGFLTGFSIKQVISFLWKLLSVAQSINH